MTRVSTLRLSCILTTLFVIACTPPDGGEPFVSTTSAADVQLMDWSEQMAVRDGWLDTRHEMLLPMMRRHDVDMWIVVNEEFHDDPLTEYIAPARPYTGRRDVFVFVDAGTDGLRKVAATGYWEETVAQIGRAHV